MMENCVKVTMYRSYSLLTFTLIVIYLFMFPTNARAEVLNENDFHFIVNNDDTVTIVKYEGKESHLSIPNTLDEKNVTTIGENAFQSKGLTNIFIPDCITEIKAYAFASNPLSTIYMMNAQMSINEFAFAENQVQKNDVTIWGYDESTAMAFADKYEHHFDSFDAVYGSDQHQLKFSPDGTTYTCLDAVLFNSFKPGGAILLEQIKNKVDETNFFINIFKKIFSRWLIII